MSDQVAKIEERLIELDRQSMFLVENNLSHDFFEDTIAELFNDVRERSNETDKIVKDYAEKLRKTEEHLWGMPDPLAFEQALIGLKAARYEQEQLSERLSAALEQQQGFFGAHSFWIGNWPKVALLVALSLGIFSAGLVLGAGLAS